VGLETVGERPEGQAGHSVATDLAAAVAATAKRPARCLERCLQQSRRPSFVGWRLVKFQHFWPGRFPGVNISEQPIDARHEPQRSTVELECLALVVTFAVKRAAFAAVKSIGSLVGRRHAGDYDGAEWMAASSQPKKHGLLRPVDRAM
jgi:hypothetical protein